MERIGVLINKLQELYSQRATPEQILHVTQMLQTELFLVKQQQQHGEERKKVAVIMPASLPIETQPAIPVEQPKIIEQAPQPRAVEQPKIMEDNPPRPIEKVEQTPEPEVELIAAEVEVKRFNVLEEVPTLAHQPMVKELNDTMNSQELSLNDKLSERRKEIGESLNTEPLKDIKKAISLNDRYIFITELFRGDEAMYERSLKTINHFSIFAEAEFWIQRELKLKLGWNEELSSVKLFDQLVQRRFR